MRMLKQRLPGHPLPGHLLQVMRGAALTPLTSRCLEHWRLQPLQPQQQQLLGVPRQQLLEVPCTGPVIRTGRAAHQHSRCQQMTQL